MLIVVAVIAILAAIAIPQYLYYAKNAKISACAESTMRCLRVTASVYGNSPIVSFAVRTRNVVST